MTACARAYVFRVPASVLLSLFLLTSSFLFGGPERVQRKITGTRGEFVGTKWNTENGK